MRFLIDSRSNSKNSLLMFFFRNAGDGRLRRQRVPVLRQAHFTIALDHQHVTGGNFLNAAKKRLRRGRRQKSEIVIERFFVDLSRDGRMLQDGFDLRSKDEAAISLVEVKRLHARTIARQHQPFAIGIPDRNPEITFDVLNKVEAALFVKMQNRFRIRARRVDVTALF